MLFDFQTPSFVEGVFVFPDFVFEPPPRQPPIIDSFVIQGTVPTAQGISASADPEN